ncbi:MAG: YeeE/YedE family protein [Pseudomonadota bacterium]
MTGWPASALAGGALIGLAAAWLYLSLGRIAGISGLLAAAVRERGAPGVPMLFLAGLAGGTLAGAAIFGYEPLPAATQPDWLWPLGGGVVALGTWLGSGCTSGHGVCGIARGSGRSFSATLTFMAIAVLVATGLYA